MSTDWKRFFKFLGERELGRDNGGEPVFLPEDFLNRQTQFIRPRSGNATAEAVEDFLQRVPAERLFDIDERLRSYQGVAFRDWPTNILSEIAISEMSLPVRQGLLFLAAGHGNGRIREQALGLLSSFPGRLTFAAALIRSVDWVVAVRKVAQQTTLSLLNLCREEDVIAVWPLVMRLAARERLDREWFGRCIESWMLRSESPRRLFSVLQSADTKVRAWAYEKALESKVPLGIDLLDSAIRDPSPRIALYALRYSARHGEEKRTYELARFGIGASHPVIRRESLRVLADMDSLLSREIIHRMLGDKAAGVRSLAAFLLRERYSENAIEYWRSVVDNDAQRPTLGALVSLADNPGPEDITRFKRWLPYPRGLVRLLCMRGILRARGEFSDDEFSQILSTPSTRLQAELAVSVRNGAIRFDLRRLMTTLTSKMATSITREQLRGLLRELNHWDRLAMILSIRPDEQLELLWFVTVLGDWVADSNRYSPLGAVRRSSLLELLEKRRDEIDDAAYRQIEQAIVRH